MSGGSIFRIGRREAGLTAAMVALAGLPACAPLHKNAVVTAPAASVAVPAAPGRVAPGALPVQLANLKGSEVMARLGAPDFRRRDPPAEMWQYRGAACVLELFLYPDGNDLRVAHAATRGRGEPGSRNAPCSPFEDNGRTS